MNKKRGILGVILVGAVFLGWLSPVFALEPQQGSYQTHHYLRCIPPSQQNDDIKYLVPPYLEVGDLLFLDSTNPPGRWNVPGFDHAAIYLGENKFIGTTTNKLTGVAEVNISDYTDMLTSGTFIHPVFARVITATPVQKQAATAWALSRIGDRYQCWYPEKIADPTCGRLTAQKWYCSEIVWAAYMNNTVGIDIDQNGWAIDFPKFFPLWSAVSPQDIADDNDVVLYSNISYDQ
jgi:hypothetical protein